MDLSHPQQSDSAVISLLSNIKLNGEEKEKDPPQISLQPIYFSGPYLRQNWSIPDSIVYYILKNPSSTKLYQKLIQTCKYFFFKNPIIVCSELAVIGQNSENGRIWKWRIEQNGIRFVIDLNNANLWITDDIKMFNYGKKNLISSIIPKIYRCDFKVLWIAKQKLSFKEYTLIASGAQDFRLKRITVTHEDGTIATLEELFKVVVNAKSFKLQFQENNPRTSSKTFKNLLQIPHFSNLDKFVLIKTPETFDLETFYAYFKKNAKPFFGLDFSPSISIEYTTRLDSIVEEILATETHAYTVPLIRFAEMGREKFRKLLKIFEAQRK